MSRIGTWLARREPPPPPDLAGALVVLETEDPMDSALAAAARLRLDEARSRPGRVRASAYRLLEADALLTYACEAALMSEDPEAALLRILAAADA